MKHHVRWFRDGLKASRDWFRVMFPTADDHRYIGRETYGWFFASGKHHGLASKHEWRRGAALKFAAAAGMAEGERPAR